MPPAGKTPCAICDSTEVVSLGRACILTASHDTPRKRLIAMAPMIARVYAAFFDCGRLKALTPFEIDSTPVSAAEPDANARRRTRTVTAPMPAVSGCGTVACGQPLVAHLTIPAPITAYSETTKPYVGSAKRKPASRTPRRFATVSARMQPRH